MIAPLLIFGLPMIAWIEWTRHGRGPIHSLTVLLIHLSAVWLLVRSMAEGAWERRERWRECLDAARRVE